VVEGCCSEVPPEAGAESLMKFALAGIRLSETNLLVLGWLCFGH